MSRIVPRVAILGAVLLAVGWLVAYSPNRVSATPVIPSGTVMASTQNGLVTEFDQTGVMLGQIDTGLGAGPANTAGSAFDTSGNFYVSDFASQTSTKFDPTGALITNAFGSGYDLDPESIVLDAAGDVFVGQADGSRQILEFDSTGTPIATFSPATESRGTDWIDLAADQCTMFYTSEGVSILTFNICTLTQGPNFNVAPLPGSNAYALRIRPNGEVLVADTEEIVRLDAVGNQIQTYAPGGTLLFALNLDPDGTSFWTGDLFSGTVFKIDIASGTILQQWSTAGAPGFTVLGGLSVKGEIVVSQPTPTATPTPIPCSQTPPFAQCPPVGMDTTCAILISVNSGGCSCVTNDPSQGPFDGIEDTLTGIQNNSGVPLCSIALSSPTNIFGFDGDGICGGYTPGPPACPYGTTCPGGSTGYEGPGVCFAVTDVFSGTVNFSPCIPVGGSAYFSLEAALTTVGACNGNGVCEATCGETCANCPADCGPCPTPTAISTLIPTPTATPTPGCGNGIVESNLGETCDPPGSVAGPCGQPCRPDCTFCGDTVVQSGDGEACDDGNCAQCDPTRPSVELDHCDNKCQGLMCHDPAKIKLTTGLDFLQFHGRMVPINGRAMDFGGSHVSISITTAQSLVFETGVPAGAIEALTNGSFHYRNAAAKQAGGIYKLKAKLAGRGTYKVTAMAYGDLSGAAADMIVHVTIGGQGWEAHGIWNQTSSGWVLHNSNFNP